MDSADEDMSLGLDYGSATPKPLLHRLEREARRQGLPLDTVELLGSHPRVCKAFLKACEAGDGRAFVDGLDLDALREWRAARSGKRSFLQRLLNLKPPGVSGLG